VSVCRIALWGLAFKPGTDDLRDAPSEVLIGLLTAAGAEVVVHDPVAMPAARRLHGHMHSLAFAVDALAAVEGADALLIATEWPEYKQADWVAVHARMAAPYVFDGRNICDPARMASLGFSYRGIGRRQFEKFAASPAILAPRSREPVSRPVVPAAPVTLLNAVSRA
jgi:UDPglucose 6-dehydrogenase